MYSIVFDFYRLYLLILEKKTLLPPLSAHISPYLKTPTYHNQQDQILFILRILRPGLLKTETLQAS